VIVLHLASCPPALRGDLTKWLFEIAAGVYVGRVSARVRDKLWSRVVETCKGGRCVLVYNTNNEQRLDFRIHGESWEPIDFDGLKLMLRPSTDRLERKKVDKYGKSSGFSNAAKIRAAKRVMGKQTSYPSSYVVIDVETTGLNPAKDSLIEIGAIKVVDNEITDTFQALISIDTGVPAVITNLTGIDDKLLQCEGQPIDTAIKRFIEFYENLPLVAHNMDFDKSFLNKAMARCNLPPIKNRTVDTLALSRRIHKRLVSYKLQDLVAHFELSPFASDSSDYATHRSLGDCHTTHMLYQKLMNS